MCALLVDIGNSSAKVYDGESVRRIPNEELECLRHEKVAYVCVDTKMAPIVSEWKNWIDLARYVELPGSYEGMGEDRKLLCSYIDKGVIVDVGSAVTVDVMEEGIYQGGFLYPGVRALERAFASISPRLACPIEGSDAQLAKDTCAQINYGALVPLARHIRELGIPCYLTGGDATLLAPLIPEAIVDQNLIFKAMRQIIQRKELC